MTTGLDEERDAHGLDAQLLSDLWVFRAAAKLGSITAAAQRLGVTQGAVSQRILRLEARLDTTLFVRNKSRITQTEAGAALLGAMTEVATVLNDTLSRISPVQRKALRVNCVPSLATEWLVPHLDDFYRLHPGIEVLVHAEVAPERVEENGADLVVAYQPESLSERHELAVVQEYVLPVCSDRYRERIEHPDEASSIVLLHDDVPWWGAGPDAEWVLWRKAAGTDWPGGSVASRRFNNAHLAYHAAACDQGVAMGRAVTVNRLLRKGELVAATDLVPVLGSTYRIMTNRPGDARSPVRQFAKWLSQAMTETQAETLALVGAELAEPVG